MCYARFPVRDKDGEYPIMPEWLAFIHAVNNLTGVGDEPVFGTPEFGDPKSWGAGCEGWEEYPEARVVFVKTDIEWAYVIAKTEKAAELFRAAGPAVGYPANAISMVEPVNPNSDTYFVPLKERRES